MSASIAAPSAAALKVPGFWRRALHHRSFVIGALLTSLLLLAAALSLVWTPWSPYEMDMASKLQGPSARHWLGTDAYGRDVASLLLVGARASILVGLIAVGIGLVVGTALGLLAAANRPSAVPTVRPMPTAMTPTRIDARAPTRSSVTTSRP